MFLDRSEQYEYLAGKGVRLGKGALENRACYGTGPREVRIAGRALSTAQWLDEWIDAQVARPIVRHRARANPEQASPAESAVSARASSRSKGKGARRRAA